MHRVIGQDQYERLCTQMGIAQEEMYSYESNLFVAIRNYTFRRYSDINDNTRNNLTNEKHEIASGLLVKALETLPIYPEQYVIRWTNLDPEFYEKLKRTDFVFSEPAFTSTSADPKFYFPGCKHKLIIEHYNGRYIAPWSIYDEEEDEVLIPAQSNFITLGFNEDEDTFLLKQLSDEEFQQIVEEQAMQVVEEETGCTVEGGVV